MRPHAAGESGGWEQKRPAVAIRARVEDARRRDRSADPRSATSLRSAMVAEPSGGEVQPLRSSASWRE